jgi:hypothetical protein
MEVSGQRLNKYLLFPLVGKRKNKINNDKMKKMPVVMMIMLII